MAINADDAVDRSTANGSTTVFPYTFRIDATSEIEVLVDHAVKALTIDYAVSGVGVAGGGNVTFLTAPANRTIVTRLRKQPFEQQTNYQANEGHPSQRVEDDFDKIWKAIQQLQEQSNRAVQLCKKSIVAVPLNVDDPVDGRFARGKTGGGVDWATPTNSTVSLPVSIGNGGTGAVTAAAARTALDVPGILADPSVDAKGDLIIGSADNTQIRLPIGTDASVLTADAASPGGMKWAVLPAPPSAGFVAGDVKLTLNLTETGWVVMDDGTIGSAASGASNRANADTSALFTVLWDNVADQWAPVSTGRGASAAADFAADKTIQLTRTLGRMLACLGTGKAVDNGTNSDVDIAADTLTVPSNNGKWVTGMAVVFRLTSGTVTGVTTGNTYYVIRQSATLIKLASSLSNAQNGAPKNFTAKSSPVWEIAHTYTARVLGEAVGKETHAQTSAELFRHRHGISSGPAAHGPGTYQYANGGSHTQSGFSGGNAAMPILNPVSFMNVLIKL